MDKLRYAIASVITLVWTAAFIADLLGRPVTNGASIGPAMLLVAGFLFASGVLNSRNGKHDD